MMYYSKILILLAIIIFFIPEHVFTQKLEVEIGPQMSIDLNWYKDSNYTFSDEIRINKATVDLSPGLNINLIFNEKIFLSNTISYSKKVYKPQRLFNWGILEAVDMSEFTYSSDIKILFSKNKLSVYSTIGISLIVELSHMGDYSNLDPQVMDFLHPSNHILTNLGFGVRQSFDNNSIQFDIKYFSGKGHYEYLNKSIDKVSLAIIYLIPI